MSAERANGLRQNPRGRTARSENDHTPRSSAISVPGDDRERPAPEVHAARFVGLMLGLYGLYIGYAGPPTAMIHRPIVLGMSIAAIFLGAGERRRRRGRVATSLGVSVDLALIVLGVAACAYVVFNNIAMSTRIYHPTTLEVVLTIGLTLSLLEGSRRATGGIAIPALALVALIYAFVGPHIPGAFGHAGLSGTQTVAMLFMYTEGIFGQVLGIAAGMVLIFLIFSGVLVELGAGDFFMRFGEALFGRMKGGTAKGAIAADTLFGTITGSAVANVSAVGPISIPMMIRGGYPPRYATAVESSASVASQVVPPLMGAAAFLVAFFVGVPYSEVAIAAVFPALLFYVGMFAQVHFKANRLGLQRSVRREASESVLAVLGSGWYYFVPLAVLVYDLMVLKSTAVQAGFRAVLVAFGVELVRQIVQDRRLDLRRFERALVRGGLLAVAVVVTLGVLGVVIGAVSTTGLGLNLSGILVDLAGGNLFVLLLVTMVASIVLGTALPTSATYLILALLVAPAIADLGVPVLAAHMFVFYYGGLADITPPTAMTVFIASKISGEPFIRTTLTACRLGLFGFLIPFGFVYYPELLALDGFGPAVLITLLVTAAIVLSAMTMEGFAWRRLATWERGVSLIAAGLIMSPQGWLRSLGVGVASLAVLRYIIDRWRTARQEHEEVSAVGDASATAS